MADVNDGQGAQADPNAREQSEIPADKTTTNRVKVETAHAAEAKSGSDDGLMDALGIPKEIQRQLSPSVVGEEPKLGDPKIDEVSGKPAVDVPALQEKEEVELGEKPEEEAKEEEPEEEQSDLKPAAESKGEKPDKVQRRIDKLTKEKKQAEEDYRRLLKLTESALGNTQPTAAATEAEEIPAASHLSYVTNEKQLNQEIGKAETLIKWCNSNSDGVEGNDGKFIDPKTIAGWKSEAELVMLSAPNRRQELRDYGAEKNHFDTLAKQAWPEMFDKDTKEYQLKESILSEFPGIRNSPRASYAVGLAIEGMKQVQRRAEAAKGRNGETAKHKDIDERVFAPRVPLAPHTPEPPSREGKTSSQKKLQDAMVHLRDDPDGSAQSLAAVLSAEEELAGAK